MIMLCVTLFGCGVKAGSLFLIKIKRGTVFYGSAHFALRVSDDER